MKNFKIIGFGGAGAKAISYIKERGIPGATFIAVDSLLNVNADVHLSLSDFEEIIEHIGNDIIYVIAGLGGSCGGQLAELAAKHEIDCCYCFMPYQFEGAERNKKAENDYMRLTALGVDIVKMDNNVALENALNEQKNLTIGELQDKAFEFIYTDVLKRIFTI